MELEGSPEQIRRWFLEVHVLCSASRDEPDTLRSIFQQFEQFLDIFEYVLLRLLPGQGPEALQRWLQEAGFRGAELHEGGLKIGSHLCKLTEEQSYVLQLGEENHSYIEGVANSEVLDSSYASQDESTDLNNQSQKTQ